jgi:hypothetical protein
VCMLWLILHSSYYILYIHIRPSVPYKPAGGLLQIDCLYELFATYLSRGLFRPRLIFARINGPNVHILIVIGKIIPYKNLTSISLHLNIVNTKVFTLHTSNL